MSNSRLDQSGFYLRPGEEFDARRVYPGEKGAAYPAVQVRTKDGRSMSFREWVLRGRPAQAPARGVPGHGSPIPGAPRKNDRKPYAGLPGVVKKKDDKTVMALQEHVAPAGPGEAAQVVGRLAPIAVLGIAGWVAVKLFGK